VSGAVFSPGRLRVKALRDRRCRAGLEFRREPRDLFPEDLGETSLAGLASLIAIAADPFLSAVFIDEDGGETPIGAEEVAEMRAVYAAELLKVSSPDATTISTFNQLQTPGGANAETDGAAALSGDAEASGGGANSEPASSITTPAGADSGPAPLTEQPRQQAADDAADRKASTAEGQKPGDAAEPPVAGTKKRNRS
jgi:hypothetical protein